MKVFYLIRSRYHPMQESSCGLSHYSEVSQDVFVHRLSSYF